MRRQIVITDAELDKLLYQAFWRGFKTAKDKPDLVKDMAAYQAIRYDECKDVKENTVVVE